VIAQHASEPLDANSTGFERDFWHILRSGSASASRYSQDTDLSCRAHFHFLLHCVITIYQRYRRTDGRHTRSILISLIIMLCTSSRARFLLCLQRALVNIHLVLWTFYSTRMPTAQWCHRHWYHYLVASPDSVLLVCGPRMS